MSKGLVAAIGVLTVAALLLLTACIEKVPQGNVAVMYSTAGVKDKTLNAGWHLVSPLTRTTDYPVRTQTKEYDKLNVATSDGKNLTMSISVNYHVDATKVVPIFNKFGNADIEQLENGYLRTRVQDGLRQSVSKYSVIETFGVKAGEIKKDTIEALQKRLEKEGFIIEDIAVSSPEADKATQASIDERVKANQELERAKTDKQIASANAEKRRIEAEGEAKANKILNDSLTPELIEKQKIDKWKGENPLEINSQGVIVGEK
ncbi:prohibitin family protein [Staphylococcus pseudintermedius]|uniref:prohibitin family protein n=1 Tax=Staphylococcus pseudintermedius TaxID=283734 RepID=UPI0018F7091B|nr:prohibitin family protein [Staphylococcus pseudintermedius]EGQ3991767.1 prohibitin family protein [Staphylococcus pseudintermedius]MBJ8311880.1 prohibitin family protein [Staphylococcus pseudintermedius]